MKNLYELFNELDYDARSNDALSVEELERKRIKQNLKMKIETRKRKRTKTTLLAVATSFAFITMTLFGLSFSTNAHQIPIIGNIYEYFNIGGFVDDIQENTDEINLVQESNGIKITINDGLYDGVSTYFTFTIESNVDLGWSPKLLDLPVYETESGSWQGYNISRINNNTYKGLITQSHQNNHDLDVINVSWKIDKIKALESNSRVEITGDWQFNFKLEQKDVKTQIVDNVISQKGIEVSVMRVTYAPNIFNIYYKYNIIDKEITRDWDDISIYIEVRDDLGNIYKSKHHGGEPAYEMTNTFDTLNSEATQLIISPIVTLFDYDGESEDGRHKWRKINSTAPIKYIHLDDIVVEIDRD